MPGSSSKSDKSSDSKAKSLSNLYAQLAQALANNDKINADRIRRVIDRIEGQKSRK